MGIFASSLCPPSFIVLPVPAWFTDELSREDDDDDKLLLWVFVCLFVALLCFIFGVVGKGSLRLLDSFLLPALSF